MLDKIKLQRRIETIATPYLENCAGLGRDGYSCVEKFAKGIATEIIAEIEKQKVVD